jgi:hypothetical protein
MISDQINKDDLHHAYLIEGDRGVVVSEIIDFIEGLGVATKGNPDFCHITTDTFRMEDARNLGSLAREKSFSTDRKVFVISTNSFLLEAQNSLLKMFEEPIEDVHFFLVVPDAGSLLPTFVSRFYFIPTDDDFTLGAKDAEKFLSMGLRQRIEFIKGLLADAPKKGDLDPTLESSRSKALKFLNTLEQTLHQRTVSKGTFDTGGKSPKMDFFHHFFKVRKFLRMPGSSPKTLLESVALLVPSFK